MSAADNDKQDPVDSYDPDRLDSLTEADLEKLKDLDFDALSADLEDELNRFEHIQEHRPTTGTVAIVLTNLLEGDPLRKVMKSRGISGEVVETSIGSLVWRQITEQPDDEYQDLLGEAAAAPAEAEKLAKEISLIVPFGAILLVAKLREHQPDLWELEGDFPWTRDYLRQQTDNLQAQLAQWEAQSAKPAVEETGSDNEQVNLDSTGKKPTDRGSVETDDFVAGHVIGQIIARVYYDGKFDHQFPAGPLVACADEILEDLLLGRTTPADYQDRKTSWFFGSRKHRHW